MNQTFRIAAPFKPSGDQPSAIAALANGVQQKMEHQTLLGVTGSGKTFTIAHVVEQVQRPTLVLAHNKTLAAQLYGEFRSFFPDNAVAYFVSYYDYYQPEAYVPASDTYIEKDSSINEHIEQLRLAATKALMERRDVLIVATVSAIYGLGAPESYLNMAVSLQVGQSIGQRTLLRRMTEIQYQRNETSFHRATYRVRGDVVDIFPAELEDVALRVEFFDDVIEALSLFDPLTGCIHETCTSYTLYPRTHYVTPRQQVLQAIQSIRTELETQLKTLQQANQLVEAQRLEQRTRFDLEMLMELGYCNGIENYSRHLSGFPPGAPPPTLFDYLPENALLVIDESHVTIPQLGAMYRGDRSRKENLVQYGFRLPSALDNRPLQFSEWEARAPQMIFVSATPADYESRLSTQTVEQLIRPTGIVDPEIQVLPANGQVDNLLGQIRQRIMVQERVLVTVLTKRMAEDLTSYLQDNRVKVRYLHSDIDTVERVEILRDLRLGAFDVLVGINLLREGLDIPEVSLVAILDADKEGFLRSERALIQTIGRAARHLKGCAILYADRTTDAMRSAIKETERRRKRQQDFNQQHHIIPQGIQRAVANIMEEAFAQREAEKHAEVAEASAEYRVNPDKMTLAEASSRIAQMEHDMHTAAQQLDFEKAALIRDQLRQLRALMLKLEG